MGRFGEVREIDPDTRGQGLRVGVALSRFNRDIGEGLLSACVSELQRLGVAPADMLIVSVPGALELPLALQSLAQTQRFDALVALGCVVKGDTYHFEVVCNESARGIAEVQLECGVPVANAVLTTYDDDQALARMHAKGAEAAQVAVEMANLARAVRELTR